MSKFSNKQKSYSALPKENTIVKPITIYPSTVKRVEKIHRNFSEFTRDALEFYLEKCEFDLK